jgi:type I restriction enzyme S subunit
MKKYQSYKSSGLGWLETIPEHWSISRLKYLGHLYGGLTGKSGVDFNNDDNPQNKPYIPYTNIFNNTYISKDHYHYVSIDEGEIQNRVRKYDLFFLMSSETHKDLGKSCILIEDVDELYLNSFCKGFRINDKNIYPLFLNYQILGHLHREMISYEGKGFTRINLRQDKLNDLFIFYPSLEEQKQIVQFLDKKTELIDKLISTKEQKIDLLKHQRTSLIKEVITKGLNSNVEIKDSGIEWIGEIPKHWRVLPLKYFGLITLGKMLTPEEKDGYILKPYLRSQNIQIDKVDISDIKEMWFSDNELQKLRLKKGDLLINEGGDVGRTSIWNEELEECYFQNSVNRVRFNEKTESIYYFLYQSHLFHNVGYYSSCVNGVSISHLTKEKLESVRFLRPPLNEQKQITEYLNIRTKEIDELVSMEQNKIDLLKEYRQSLISEVITGKIDVRTNLN